MAKQYKKEPIAIIGMACKFPGANNLESYWNLLACRGDAISKIPASRFKVDDYYDPDPSKLGKMSTQWGGFLAEPDMFDPGFFGISPREAAIMTADQRLVLEMAWTALNDAGIPVKNTTGQYIGVFVGTNSDDYAARLEACVADEPHLVTGTSRAVIANRISYLYDWNGPSLTVDTACSSSLVATHLACNSLWRGESSLALAGGVQLHLRPELYISFTKGGFMAPDGRCKAFDASADGYVRSEGVGMVVLKPLSLAIEDGNAIYAVIQGSAVNHNGRSNGLTAPNPLLQESLMRAAYQDAGISPGQVQYIEAHGTGTSLGDYMELEALQTVLAEGRPEGRGCKVGSVKTNIGHAEGAAGIAGLIKTALALKNQQIPPNLHFNTPNPRINFEKLPLQVPQELEPWPAVDGPRLAGVSSFGFGGTNAHLVLKQAPDEHDHIPSHKAFPEHSFDKQSFWINTTPAHQQPVNLPVSLPGQRIPLPLVNQIFFQSRFTKNNPDYLLDHQYYGKVVVAGASHIVMALLAGQQILEVNHLQIKQIQFLEVLGFNDDIARTVQVVLEPRGRRGYEYKLMSCVEGHEDWKTHAIAKIEEGTLPEELMPIESIRSRCKTELSGHEYYEALLQPMAGRFSLGPSFQCTERTWLGDNEALIQLKSLQSEYWPHPGMLDSGLVAIPFLHAYPAKDTEPVSYAFSGAKSVELLSELSQKETHWFYVKIDQASGAVVGDAYLLDSQGVVKMILTGVEFKELKSELLLRALEGGDVVDSDKGPELIGFIEELQQVDAVRRQYLLNDYLAGVVAQVLQREENPDPTEGFFNLGMDSLMAVDLVDILQKDLGIQLTATAAFEYANIEELAGHLGEALSDVESEVEDIPEKRTIADVPNGDLDQTLIDELMKLEQALK